VPAEFARCVDLTGKTALITGATAGIGKAIATDLARAGANVIITGRRQERLDELAKQLAAPGVTVATACFDVSNKDAVADAFASHPAMVDVDILVNNAGLARGTEPMQSADPDDWEEMIATNVVGLLRMTRPIAAAMSARRDGHIINLGSVAGRWTYPGGGVYCATKAAVATLSEGLRMDLIGRNVRVTNIEPGLVETEFSMVRFSGDEAKAKAVYQDTRALRPADVAETVRWCLQRPDHVNIQELVLFPTDQSSVRDVHRQ
jgi:3-hydroxy acid dehydrogenase/malonic semialdehyde reductase